MKIHPGDVAIGIMMAVCVYLGAVLAAHALDIEMRIFGLSLAGFGVLFILGQIRRIMVSAQEKRMEQQHG